MTPTTDNEDKQAPELAGDLLDELSQIEQHLRDGLEQDARLESGVPESQRTADLDFIHMSGIANPESVQPPATTSDTWAETPDTDTSQPLSFYEKGVVDVDAEMATELPEDIEAPKTSSDESRDAMADLRGIIARPESPTVTPTAMAATTAVATAAATAAPQPPLAPPPSVESIEPDESMHALFEIPSGGAEDFEMFSATGSRAEIPVADGEEESAHPVPPSRQAPSMTPPDLAEAEALLVALQSQPREIDLPEPPQKMPDAVVVPQAESLPISTGVVGDTRIHVSPAPELPETPPAPAVEEETEEDSALDSTSGTRRYGRHRTKRPIRVVRRMLRAAVLLGCIGVLALLGYEGYRWMQLRLSSPAKLYAEASELAAKGHNEEASEQYARFARMNPDDPKRGEAQFAAAFLLQLPDPVTHQTTQDAQVRSLELFQEFVGENPAHGKTPRAISLMGLLSFKLGRYEQAIDLLRDPELRLRDSVAALPNLRTLARAYSRLGDFESACSAYLQAVSMTDNRSADVDYTELGALYQHMGERAAKDAERREYQQLAVQQWKHAIQVPAIDPSSKSQLQTQISVLQKILDDAAGPGTGAAPPVPADTGKSSPPPRDVDTSVGNAGEPLPTDVTANPIGDTESGPAGVGAASPGSKKRRGPETQRAK